ncbi:MAG: BlaI/MecI/CopY family transcriptional regulator [Pirellulales bacterium]
MAKRAAVTKAELDVARVVWRLGRATVREVVDSMPDDRIVDFWTTQTYLRRLASKGYLHCRREGRTNVYRPAVRPKSALRALVNDLIRRLFDGRAAPLVQHVIEDYDLSPDEIDELQRSLDELRRRKK